MAAVAILRIIASRPGPCTAPANAAAPATRLPIAATLRPSIVRRLMVVAPVEVSWAVIAPRTASVRPRGEGRMWVA